jgi:predicted ABC-type ATPase
VRALRDVFEAASSGYKHPSGHTKRLFHKTFKALGYPVGTVRNWTSGKVVKTAKGWEEVPHGTKSIKVATPAVPAAKHDVPVISPKVATKSSVVPSHPPDDDGPWIDSVPGFPDETVHQHYGADRAPKAYRQKLHDQILGRHLDKVKAPNEKELKDRKPVAIMLMGGPASGKSTIGSAYPHGQFVHLDADALKEHLPEYKVAVKWRAKNAAKMTHAESIHLMQQLRTKTIAAKKNLVMDGTGRHLHSYLSMIEKLKAAGYHVKVVLADIDKDLAFKRAKLRAKVKGRSVPSHIFDAAYSSVPKNFSEIANAGDEFEVWDTRPDGASVLKWEKTNGVEKAHDSVFVKKFRSKHVSAPSRASFLSGPNPLSPQKREAVSALKTIFAFD